MPQFGLEGSDSDDESFVVVQASQFQSRQKMIPIRLNDEHDDLQYSDDEDRRNDNLTLPRYGNDKHVIMRVDTNNSDDDSDSDDDNQAEPPHPMGFQPQWGQCWFGLQSPLESRTHSQQFRTPRSRISLYDSDDDEEDHDMDLAIFSPDQRQSFPALSNHVDAMTAPTSALLAYDDHQSRTSRDRLVQAEQDVEMAMLSKLFATACATHSQNPILQHHHKLDQQLMESLPTEEHTMAKVQQKTDAYRQHFKVENDRAHRHVRRILAKEMQKAAEIQRKEKELRAEAEAVQRKQKEADDAAAEAQRQQEEAVAKAKREEQQKQVEEQQQAQREKEQKADKERAAAAAASPPRVAEPPPTVVDFVGKAKKLVGQLVDLRASVAPFEKSKAVSKRRLKMKKVVGGKVNTLTDANKVRQVAAEVCEAITLARQEDDQAKQALKANQPGVAPEMVRGKRYLLDLLASKAMTRIQADGFSGTKGDGFPLAGLLAMVSVENKELVPILAAHIYTVCPTAVPTLPTPKAGASEEELMATLGMIKEKNGEYETFPKFLTRTENIMSMVSNIMASLPSGHVLLGGHKAALDWLQRFLDLLPPETKPLPLLTAPVLASFLTGAGHMLANKYADEFEKCFHIISTDIVKRLDETVLGKPSATRLQKAVEGGVAKYKSTLPPKALAELYHGTSVTTFGSSSTTSKVGTSFGGGGGGGAPNPFGGGGGGSTNAPNPFGGGGGGGASMNAPNPFGGGGMGNASAPSPFGGGGASTNAPDPFGGGGNAPAPSPFGGGGMGNAPSPSPFGGGGGMGNAPAPSPFGGGVGMGNTNTSNPFGGGGMGNAPAPSPFGGGGGGMSNASPFGGGGNAPAPSPFGGGMGNAPAPSPFGGGMNAPAPSPFGGGGMSNPSPFGGGGGGGGGMSNQSPFGGGGGGMSNPSPFGGGIGAPSSQSPFGGGMGGNSGSGQNKKRGNTRNKKPPCKFYAQGNCRYGNNCKFSHDGGGGGGGGGQSYGNSPFGSSRR